jgi:hypothetical protein
MSIERIEITTEAGELITAMAHFVVPASRSTNPPAFYSDWFMRRPADKEHGAFTAMRTPRWN